MIGYRSRAEQTAIIAASEATECDGIMRAVYRIDEAGEISYRALPAGTLAKPHNGRLCFITTARVEERSAYVYSILL